MRKMLRFSLLILATAAFSTVHAAGSGGGGLPSIPQQDQKSPEEVAEQNYKRGIKNKERAWKQEAKAEKAKNDKARDKALARAQKAYEKAAKYQAAALKADPRHYRAANELGYALRKTGDYKQAIGAYNYALEINPKFYEAIEYRGEALLRLGFIEEAKDAYMTLFRNDRELADQLMTAMDQWLSEQEADDTAREFAEWMRERKQLATIGQNLSSNNSRSW